MIDVYHQTHEYFTHAITATFMVGGKKGSALGRPTTIGRLLKVSIPMMEIF